MHTYIYDYDYQLLQYLELMAVSCFNLFLWSLNFSHKWIL